MTLSILILLLFAGLLAGGLVGAIAGLIGLRIHGVVARSLRWWGRRWPT